MRTPSPPDLARSSSRSSTGRSIDHRLNGIAGVANTGRDMNWTGHHFGQANWYAYGRLAWNPGLSARRELRDEWIAMTWGHADRRPARRSSR